MTREGPHAPTLLGPRLTEGGAQVFEQGVRVLGGGRQEEERAIPVGLDEASPHSGARRPAQAGETQGTRARTDTAGHVAQIEEIVLLARLGHHAPKHRSPATPARGAGVRVSLEPGV